MNILTPARRVPGCRSARTARAAPRRPTTHPAGHAHRSRQPRHHPRRTKLDPETPAEDATEDPGADVPLHFDGYATVYESPYEMWDMFGPYTEVVAAGAAADTLANRTWTARWCWGTTSCAASPAPPTAPSPSPRMRRGCARRRCSTRGRGRQYIAPKIAAGLIDEMSFCFRITAGQWSPDYTEYRIEVRPAPRRRRHRRLRRQPATTAALRSASPAAVRLALAAAL